MILDDFENLRIRMFDCLESVKIAKNKLGFDQEYITEIYSPLRLCQLVSKVFLGN